MGKQQDCLLYLVTIATGLKCEAITVVLYCARRKAHCTYCIAQHGAAGSWVFWGICAVRSLHSQLLGETLFWNSNLLRTSFWVTPLRTAREAEGKPLFQSLRLLLFCRGILPDCGCTEWWYLRSTCSTFKALRKGCFFLSLWGIWLFLLFELAKYKCRWSTKMLKLFIENVFRKSWLSGWSIANCNHKSALLPDPHNLQLFKINSRGSGADSTCLSSFTAIFCVMNRMALSLICRVLKNIVDSREQNQASAHSCFPSKHSNSNTFGLEHALDAYWESTCRQTFSWAAHCLLYCRLLRLAQTYRQFKSHFLLNLGTKKYDLFNFVDCQHIEIGIGN